MMDPCANFTPENTFMVKANCAQRRSACDDCRARKVQCSGDASGCQRCRRADIRCFYSAPKPPGRPRKVRRVEDSQPHLDDQLHQRVHYQHQHVSTPPVPTPGFFFGDFFGAGELMDQGMESNTALGGNLQLGLDFPGLAPVTPEPFSVVPSPGLSDCLQWTTPPPPPLESTNFTALPILPQPCQCLSAFFTAISTLRTPPSSSTFALAPALTSLRATISTITTSMHCSYCHSSAQSTYICMMMLGTLIPLLLLYIENALSSISAFTQESVTVDLGGVEVDLGHDAWQDLARRAVGKEYNVLMSLVDEVEGILKLRHCAGKKEEGLGAIVKAGGGALAGEAVQRELGNKNHETGEPPFCLGLLWMIRGMAERIGVGVVGAN